MEALKLICAWCGALIREGKLPISHGLCRGCADRMAKELQQEKEHGNQ